MVNHSDRTRSRQIQRVLINVLLLNFVVAVAKIVVGLLTNTLSMVADGFHSTMDASSNIIGIVGTFLAARPADESHPYGHRRFETMATLTIGGGLLLAAWEIIKAAIERFSDNKAAVADPLTFAIMFGTIGINLFVVVYETSNGKRLRSDLLLADASQTRMDIFVSASVILSLVMTLLGIAWMDTLIALVIVVLIVRTAISILWKTTQVLVDAVAIDAEEMRRVVAGVPGVANILRIRSRGPADTILADIDVQVQPATTTDAASAIADEIDARVKAAFSGVTEVQVHFAPHHDNPKDYKLQVRAAADALGLSVHEVTEILTSSGTVLEMHVEVLPTLTLAAAHQQVTELERRVRANLPEISDVLTHIEPAINHAGAVMQTAKATAIRDEALSIAKELYPNAHWHDATIRLAMGGYAMTLHCWLEGDLSVQEAHEIAEQVETQIRARLPQVQRVTIHTEPPEEEPVETDELTSEP